MSEERPSVLDVNPEGIPNTLKERDRWVCWRSKRPIEPKSGDSASHSNPDTWGTFREALDAHRSGIYDTDGIGYVFASDGPMAGVDLDDCRDPETGEIENWAVDIIGRLDSFTEVSPSGTGLHIIALGSIPDCGNKKGNVEMYDEKRYFSVTGQHVPDTPTDVQNAANALAAIHEEYFAGAHPGPESCESTPAPQNRNSIDEHGGNPSGAASSLSDRAVIEKAKAASNGEKFRRLWNGTTTGYQSHSEADLALCNMLAWYTNGNRQQMDRLFRYSSLYRAKWDERNHHRDGRTYGELTIDKAIRDTDGAYLTENRSPFVDTDGPCMATSDGGRNRVSVQLLHSVFSILNDQGPTGTADVADRIDYSQQQTRNALNYLESGDWVRWERDGRRSYWVVQREP
jgi:putative DNA primase/helicase